MPASFTGNGNSDQHQSNGKAVAQKASFQPAANEYACPEGQQHTPP